MSLSRILRWSILSFALASVALGAGVTPARVNAVEHDIGNKVYCMCGCAATLNHCPDLHCPVKAKMHAIIRTDLEQGKTEPAILHDLVAIYGEKVLASPPPQGFNLTAWILPGVGLLIGLFLAITIVRKWHRPALQTAGASNSTPVDDNVRSAVEDEMKKFMD